MRNPSRLPQIARVTALAIAVGAVFSAGSAMAADNLYGGGSTLAAIPYVGTDFTVTSPNQARLSTNIAGETAGTLSNGTAANYADIGNSVSGAGFTPILATYNTLYGNFVSYCQTGSGFGKNALNNVASAPGQTACGDFSNAAQGLNVPSTQPFPDFVGTDTPYSTTDYTNFINNGQVANYGGVIQVPVLAGAIGLAYNSSITTNPLNLGTVEVCKIYSGMVTSWKSVTGAKGTLGNITIVYRSDSSGTTYNFTNWLANSCNGTPYVPSGFKFTPNSTFTSALPTPAGGGATTSIYANSIGESGNSDVLTATTSSANVGALGYADESLIATVGARAAEVNNIKPSSFGLSSTGTPVPVTISSTYLLKGDVVNGATVAAAPSTIPTTIAACMRVVNPSFHVPSTGYPIVGITYLAGYYKGNNLIDSTHAAALQNLYNLYYNDANRPVLPTGFAYLDGQAAFGAAVKATISSCVKP